MDWPAVITSAVFAGVGAGVGAYVGSYLKERGKLQAMQEKIDSINKPLAEIAESAKLRWGKRGEVFAEVYGSMGRARIEIHDYCYTNRPPTEADLKVVYAAHQGFTSRFFENALFLPPEIVVKMAELVRQYAVAIRIATILGPEAESTQGTLDEATRQKFLKQKKVQYARLQEGGDLDTLFKEIDVLLRKELEV